MQILSYPMKFSQSVHKIDTLSELSVFAQHLAGTLCGSEVLLLSGELGAGKTTFVQEFVKALESNAIVTSPTFVLRNDYIITNHKIIKQLIHIDLYRLEKWNAERIEFFEDIGRVETVTCIEWPERIKNIKKLSGKLVSIRFEIIDKDARKIIISEY